MRGMSAMLIMAIVNLPFIREKWAIIPMSNKDVEEMPKNHHQLKVIDSDISLTRPANIPNMPTPMIRWGKTRIVFLYSK